MTRSLLAFACRAFPGDHRARRSDEIVDTALLAAGGSVWRTVREALSLVLAGLGQRLRSESDRSIRDGLAPLAWVLAVVNLAVALAGASAVNPPFLPFASRSFPPYTYRPDWWWIAFAIAAAGIVLGLALGDRRLAFGAALANLGVIAYDAIFPAHVPYSGGLLDLIFFGPSFPAGRQWLAPAVVLTVAIAAAPFRRPPLACVPLAVGAVVLLVVLSREMFGHFLFLRWPLAGLVLLTIAFGVLIPRLAVLAFGLVLAAAPSSVTLFAGSNIDRASVIWSVAVGFILAAFVPFVRLVRRRLT